VRQVFIIIKVCHMLATIMFPLILCSAVFTPRYCLVYFSQLCQSLISFLGIKNQISTDERAIAEMTGGGQVTVTVLLPLSH
jgi:hypothetical protein